MASYTGIFTTNAWATGANWSPTGPPSTSGDSATLDQNAIGSIAGSDQSATTLSSLTIKSTFILNFGDLATPLKVNATTVRIGDPGGSPVQSSGSPRINLDLSTTASNIAVVSSSTQGIDTGLEPIRIKGVNSSNKISVTGSAIVGIATNASGDVATFGEIACLSGGATIRVGSGVTLTTWSQDSGTGNLYCGMTTFQQDGGIASIYGTGTITTANVSGQTTFTSSGTITTLNVYGGGSANFLNSSIPRTITTVNLYKGATFSYDPAVMTITNPINFLGCQVGDVTVVTPNSISAVIAKL